MSEAQPIARPFPRPPDPVRDRLRQLAREEDQVGGGLSVGEDGPLDRPWDPADCRDELRAAVWDWCGEVASWLNREYAWRPAHLIPACWPRHAHIAHELALLAVLRWRAQHAAAPEPLDDWHRFAYPAFCERMSDRLGEGSCLGGTHQEWPAESRYLAFAGPGPDADRRQVLEADRRRR